MQKAGAEFGYRSANEINTLVGVLENLTKENKFWGESEKVEINPDDFIDIAIMQKLLPKLHGSRARLVTILASLAKLCIVDQDQKYDKVKDKDNKAFIKDCFDGELPADVIKYKISFEKIKRMYKNVMANGFTSYAEA